VVDPVREAITTETPAVVANGEVVYLCDGSHTEVFERLLIQGESSSGGAQSFTGILPAAATPSVGVVKVLFIPAIFTDQNETPITEAGAYDMMRQSADFYQANSFGRLTLVATVTPPVRLPHNRAWYTGKDTTSGFIKEIDGLGLEMSHAKEAARRAGYDWQDYHATVVRANGGARAPTSYGGGGNVWMRVDSVSTATHEIGHAFLLAHANFWETNGASVIGPGGNVEYGNNYDNMGGASPPNGHYNAQAKNQVRWMPDEFAPPVTVSGTYRVHRFDQAGLEPGKRYALRLRKDNDRTYWGEYRLLGGNNWTNSGLLLGWKWAANGGSNQQLLDTTPGSINGKSDAGITVGRTFSDFESGIHLTTLAVNNTTPASLDVVVNLGTFPSNRAPVLQLTPASTVVPLNTNVTFTASASDPDGDTPAYSWQWHDNVISGNGPTVTRSFSVAGVYTLNCVVSDMKGGLAVRNAVITVGNGNSRFTISGRITRNGSGIPNINVGTGGANGTRTDSDGYYTIANLAAGNYSVAPASHGLVFNELFNNSVTVGPSFSGADFTAEDLPVIAIEAVSPVAVEGGSSGTFRLSRTGPDGLAQAVLLFAPQGTASKGTATTGDYTLSPDPVSAGVFQSVTIPAGSGFVDVTVAARNDGSSEGYETVTLVLANDASYIPGAKNSATVAIQDANSSLPRVSLTAGDAQTSEAGAPVTVTVTRTGATTDALTVPYAVAATSTATSGADYLALPGTVTIPGGAASASFVIQPLDDPEAEATESLTLSISGTANFLADVSANVVTVRLIDDDTRTVTVMAADANATEVDRAGTGVPDPGTFLITRSGDTAAPLTVFYSVAGTALHGVDYDALPGSVIIPAGRAQASITIMPRSDNFGEGAETVVLAIGSGFGFYQAGANGSATVTLNDAPTDKPLLEVTASSGIASEPSGNGTFRITAKGGTAGALTVNYTITGTATAGSDYTLTGLNPATLTGTTTINLTGGTVTSNLTLTVLNDTSPEEMESITLTLSPGPNYALWEPLAAATMSLRDDEQPTVRWEPEART
jgi:plastocyanin